MAMEGHAGRILLLLCITAALTSAQNDINQKQAKRLKLSKLLGLPAVKLEEPAEVVEEVVEEAVEEGDWGEDVDVDMVTGGHTHHPPETTTHHHHDTHPPGHGTTHHHGTHHPPGHGTTHHHGTHHPPGHGTHPPGHGTHPPGHGTHPPGHGGHGDMKMYFHVSDHATILFETWHTMTQGHMAGSCIGLAIIAVLYEGFKVLREHLMFVASSRKITSEKGIVSVVNTRMSLVSGWHILQAFLHIVQAFISYCLMLVFMTYNAWLCVSILLGMMFGYYFFAWMKPNNSSDTNEHCA